ncbi:MAG: CBS domain-containing protein [Victivallaceae bacterium]|nr:CBS domain-containing protein [Victivallaceae bacterium]
MKLASILNGGLIFSGIRGGDRREIYSQMLELATQVIGTLDVGRLTDKMIEREDAIEIPYDGVALPHLRMAEINDLYIIIARLDTPVKMQSGDVAPCRMVVMSLISQETSDLYLKSLAAMLRFAGVGDHLGRLLSAPDADAFIEVLRAADVKVRSCLAADDLLHSGGTTINVNDSLARAIDLFSRDDRPAMPVVDDDGKLVGELDAKEVLHRFIPEYIFRMDNLDFLDSFEPFNRIFKEETERVVRDYMQPARLVVRGSTPLIQFTVRMVKHDVRITYVIDEDGKYLGEVTVKDIVKKVLRG